MQARISRGNTKLGTVANLSLTPVSTCRKDCPCRKLCYALKSQRMYAATRKMRAHNVQAYKRTPRAYFDSIVDQTRGLAFFRWHVAGDCIDREYVLGVLEVARRNPECRYLIFTKRYDLWNDVMGEPYPMRIPSNLSIVFSAWPGYPMHNPHGLPIAFMVPKEGEESRLDGTEIACPGNCETCGMCWELGKLGRNVAFHQH